MRVGAKNVRSWIWGCELIVVGVIAGCNPSASDVMQQTFDLDPPVQVEYQPDGSRIYKTRNIVLFADFGKSQLSSLVMLVALSGEPTSQDTSAQIGGLVKFRSIDRVAHFEANRNLILAVGSQEQDLGPCAYEQETLQKGGKAEDLTVMIPQPLVRKMAEAETVRGKVGEVEFTLTREQLLPVRALVDTVRAR